MPTAKPASSQRREPTRAGRVTGKKPAVVSPDDLADRLGTTLVISNAAGKRKATTSVGPPRGHNIDGEECRLASMRAVNGGLQSLAVVVQSGWKRFAEGGVSSLGKNGATLSDVQASATSISTSIRKLRELGSGDLDVERAALSFVGKLVSLEMFETALIELAEMHGHLCALYHPDYSKKPPAKKRATIPKKLSPSDFILTLSLPLPPSGTLQDPILSSLLSTYLLHSLASFSQHFISPRTSSTTITISKHATILGFFSKALLGQTTLLTWIPSLPNLPHKQKDSLLTSAYTILAKSTSSSPSTLASLAVFNIRSFALSCLLHTSPDVVDPNTFWAQATKFGTTFLDTAQSNVPNDDSVRTLLSTFSGFVDASEKTTNRDAFMAGRGFTMFCQFWMKCARQVEDICVIERITSLTSSLTTKELPVPETVCNTHREKGSDSPSSTPSRTQAGEDELFAVFNQATSLLEQYLTTPEIVPPDLSNKIQEAATVLRDRPHFLFSETPTDERRKHVNKTGKAFEKLRRAAVKVTDTSRLQGSEVHEASRLFLVSAADGLENAPTLKTEPDLQGQALDTLFTLARVTVVAQDPRTYNPAFEFLMRATRLYDSGILQTESQANFARCTSGVFYNLAGTLYQENRWGPAVRFLKEACAHGIRALAAYKSGILVKNVDENWTTLEHQLYRRWELLAVCYLKIGDRQLAFDAFLQAIKAFPYSRTDLIAQAGSGGSSILNTTTHLKQLGSIVEKFTYMGTCDLFLDPASVSLRGVINHHPTIIGILLERQLDSLSRSLWKDGVSRVVSTLLLHAKEVYPGDEMPLRRARILLRCLDFSYHVGLESSNNLGTPLLIGEELAKLLTCVNFGQDGALAPFCLQYRASMHLWLAMHAHRRMDEQQTSLVASHVDDACKDLKEALGTALTAQVTSPHAKKSGGTQSVTVKKRPTRGTVKGLFGNEVGEPITPKARNALDSLNESPPKTQTATKKPHFLLEDPERLLSLLETTASLLGLLGLTLSRISVLEVMRQICERHVGTLDNEYLVASTELAHQFVKLGKVRRAVSIYNQAFNKTRGTNVLAELRVHLLLRHAEALAMLDNISKSSSIYCDAYSLSNGLREDQGTSTSQRVRARVGRLERAAIAAHAFALIQRATNDPVSWLDGLLQSLRLWNRAVDSLARLRPCMHSLTPPPAEPDPFAMNDLKEALPITKGDVSLQSKSVLGKFVAPRFTSDNLELRVAHGLLDTLFALSEAYITRGSAREAEYFAQQAQEFALSLNAPAMAARAVAWIAEVQLHQGRLQDGYESLVQARDMLKDTLNTDCADVRRLHGDYNQRCAQIKDARLLYAEATGTLEDLEDRFTNLEASMSRRKSISSPHRSESISELLAPRLYASVLHQHIWLIRDEPGEHVKVLVDRLLSLPPLAHVKMEENAVMAKLALHKMFLRIRADMFLSSFAESPITMPMGISGGASPFSASSTKEILKILADAEKLFWADLNCGRGKVPSVRNATLSLALIKALQTSLGKSEKESTATALNLLDASTGITLRREMLETIQNKFPDLQTCDDLQWPLINQNGAILPRPKSPTFAQRDRLLDSDEERESVTEDKSLKEYWKSIQARYQSQVLDAAHLSRASADQLPKNWTVVNISVTEDKSTMFVTRQRADTEPLIFCLPLKGRRESDEDEHLTFEDAMTELRTIVELSDEGTRQASNVKGDDIQARAAWWAERNALDKRMQELLENIEFCWLGAFKMILSQPASRSADVISDLRTRLDRVFQNGLRSQEKKKKTRIRLDDNLLECFSALSPNCRDEELEDLVYFILDLYQSHGVGVAISEVDIDHVVVDLRMALEEHAEKTRGKVIREKDSHMFLVLDRNVQGVPWESIPILRGRSVSRIPSMDFLLDRVQLAAWQREGSGSGRGGARTDDRVVVDPRKTYYVLNPSGDLGRTEGRFVSWLKEMRTVGWEGVVGQAPSEQQFLDALSRKDLVIYFGHGGGEQYVRSHKIRNLPRCAATMLWGCSSGTLREMGDFERVGTPHNYMLSGCPCLVANIWDVTDRDIDKFAQSVFDQLHMTVAEVGGWQQTRGEVVSLVAAVAASRDACKLKYLTGAAPVVYGIPFYL